MTKNQLRATLAVIPVTVLLLTLIFSEKKPSLISSASQINTQPPQNKNVLKDHFRSPASIRPTSRKSMSDHTKTGPVWKRQLEKALMVQANGTLKKLEIEKVDSFDWKVGKVDVRVDSVIVKLEHIKGHRSSFRAIVDSNNGKILQTWDQPLFDNFGSKSAGIRIDPRYHQD